MSDSKYPYPHFNAPASDPNSKGIIRPRAQAQRLSLVVAPLVTQRSLLFRVQTELGEDGDYNDNFSGSTDYSMQLLSAIPGSSSSLSAATPQPLPSALSTGSIYSQDSFQVDDADAGPEVALHETTPEPRTPTYSAPSPPAVKAGIETIAAPGAVAGLRGGVGDRRRTTAATTRTTTDNTEFRRHAMTFSPSTMGWDLNALSPSVNRLYELWAAGITPEDEDESSLSSDSLPSDLSLPPPDLPQPQTQSRSGRTTPTAASTSRTPITIPPLPPLPRTPDAKAGKQHPGPTRTRAHSISSSKPTNSLRKALSRLTIMHQPAVPQQQSKRPVTVGPGRIRKSQIFLAVAPPPREGVVEVAEKRDNDNDGEGEKRLPDLKFSPVRIPIPGASSTDQGEAEGGGKGCEEWKTEPAVPKSQKSQRRSQYVMGGTLSSLHLLDATTSHPPPVPPLPPFPPLPPLPPLPALPNAANQSLASRPISAPPPKKRGHRRYGSSPASLTFLGLRPQSLPASGPTAPVPPMPAPPPIPDLKQRLAEFEMAGNASTNASTNGGVNESVTTITRKGRGRMTIGHPMLIP